jgi:hypothetical protein
MGDAASGIRLSPLQADGFELPTGVARAVQQNAEPNGVNLGKF